MAGVSRSHQVVPALTKSGSVIAMAQTRYHSPILEGHTTQPTLDGRPTGKVLHLTRTSSRKDRRILSPLPGEKRSGSILFQSKAGRAMVSICTSDRPVPAT